MEPTSKGPTHPIRVAFVGLRGIPAVYGGVDRVVEEISTRLAGRGRHVLVYCWSNIYQQKPSEYGNIRLKYLPTIPVRYIGTLIHTLLGCASAARQDIDIVHINNTENAIFSFIPRLFGKKAVIQPHGPAWPVLRWGTFRDRFLTNLKIRLQRAYLYLCRFPTLSLAHKIVVISGPDAEYISKRNTDKFVLIHNGCNLPEIIAPDRMTELSIPPREYLLFVGRLVPRKGCHYLIQAFRSLQRDLKLVIVGGPLDTAYGRYLRRLAGEDQRIMFLGPVYDRTLKELFSNPLIYVHPSESEGQSVSLLEGLAYGNCVVTSNTPESVETAEGSAVYFQSGNWQDLQRVLEELTASPDEIEAKRAQARQHVERNYQWDDKVTQYEALYSALSSK